MRLVGLSGRTDPAPPLLSAALLALVHLALAVAVFDPTLHTGGDNAAYLDLARSLLDHGRYLGLWDPARPPHLQYPPGFPVLIAGPLALGIQPWPGLKILVMLISGLAVGVSYLWARTRVGPWAALGVGLAVAAAPGVLGQSHWILSDVPFWAATMGAFLAAATGRPGWGVAMAFVALAFRTAGLPLVVGFAIWFAFRGRWKAAVAVILVFAAAVAVWTLRGRGVETPYAGEFWLLDPYDPDAGTVGLGGLAARVWTNVGRYGWGLLGEFLFGDDRWLANVGALTVLGMGLVGAVAVGRAKRPALEGVWLALYVSMLLLWPSTWASERFLLPVLPLVLAAAVLGIRRIRPAPLRRLVLALGIAGLLAGGAPDTLYAARNGAACRHLVEARPDRVATECLPADIRSFLALAEWSRDRLPADAVVISRKPTLFHWFSGRPGRTYPFSREEGALIDAMESAGARYLVVDELGGTVQRYLLPALREDVGRFCMAQAMRDGDAEAVLLGLLEAPAPADTSSPASITDPRDSLDFGICPAGYVVPPRSGS